MRVEYSKRAIADLRKIGAYYRDSDDPRVAMAIERRVREVVARVWPIARERTPCYAAAGNSCRARAALPLQDFLSRDWRNGSDRAHTPHGAAAVDGRVDVIFARSKRVPERV